MRARTWLLVAALSPIASPVSAQLGEAQVGVIASYGTGLAAQPGGGLVLGVAVGRLTYGGLRWTSYGTTTTTQGPAASPNEVRNSQHVFAVDIGLLIPEGQLEVIPEVSIGFARFAQHSRLVSGGPESADYGTELLAAPGVAVEVRAGRLAFIPELQYAFVGKPDLPFPAEHQGLVASLRVVLWFEVRRIRH